MNNIERKAVECYEHNMSYLKDKHKLLYQKIKLFEVIIETGKKLPEFELEYKDDYFDIFSLQENEFFYGMNSFEYSLKKVDEINFESKLNSFKTFYDYKYDDEVFETAKKKSIEEHFLLGNAPVVHYVNSHLPKIEKFQKILKYIIFGVGLGIHLSLIKTKVKAEQYLIVEPSLEIFRLSLFVTNYEEFSKDKDVYFLIAEDDSSFYHGFKSFFNNRFLENHYLKFFLFSESSKIYTHTIQDFLVSQSHNLYSYSRLLKSFRLTKEYLDQEYKILDISKRHQLSFANKKVILLAAGPSLQNEIEFLKLNKEKFVIIAILAVLPLLEKEGIVPDIVTHYDEKERVIKEILSNMDVSFFSDSIFLLSSHIPFQMLEVLNQNQVFMMQAQLAIKKTFGVFTAPAIGDITYFLLLCFGFKNIYLLGTDLALEPETNKTHIDEHEIGAKEFDFDDRSGENNLSNYSTRKEIILVKGNFLKEVKTFPAFKTSINNWKVINSEYKHEEVRVYNFSNGAYLEETIPLLSVQFKSDKTFDKELLRKELLKELNSISENYYSEEDKEYLDLVLKGSQNIIKHIEEFKTIEKYSNVDVYKRSLILFLHKVLFEEDNCKDLQRIIQNYCEHNIHYIFYYLNLSGTSNNKKFIKNINKLVIQQLEKIVYDYIKIID